MEKRITNLIDSAVRKADGRKVGSVDEVILDWGSGRISHLVVEKADSSRICLPWRDVELSKRGFILRE